MIRRVALLFLALAVFIAAVPSQIPTLGAGGKWTLPSTLALVPGNSSSNNTTTLQTMSCTLPSTPTVGNMIDFFVSVNTATDAITAPDSMTADGTPITTGHPIYEYHRIVQSGDGTSWSFTNSAASGEHWSVTCAEVTGENASSPINLITYGSFSGSPIASSATSAPTSLGTLPIAAFGEGSRSSYTGLTTLWNAVQTVTASWFNFTVAGPLTTDTSTVINASLTPTGGTAAGNSVIVFINPAPAVGVNLPSIGGCNFFPANDFYNTSIATAAPDPSSSPLITNMAAQFANVSGANTDIILGGNNANGYFINRVDGTVPAYPLWSTTLATPLPSSSPDTDFRLNGSTAWQNQANTDGIAHDHHLLEVDTSNCTEHESYVDDDEASGASPSWWTSPNPGQTTTCPAGKVCVNSHYGQWYNLNNTLPTPTLNGAAVNLAGTPYVGGMVRFTDYENNTPHVLNIDVPVHSILNTCGVYPSVQNGDCTNTDSYYGGSGASACNASCTNAVPTGTHLRLKSTVSVDTICPPGTNPQSNWILHTMQNYGGVISDTGSLGIFVYVPQMQASVGATFTWGDGLTGAAHTWNLTDLDCLNNVQFNSTNWDVVPPPGYSTIAAARV